MDSRSLHAFLTLADTLHFGRAAKACFVSPSTLSRTINKLEADIGVALFDRDNRHVALTKAGTLFRDYARESTSLWASFRNSLMDETRELTGEIAIYCSVTASYSFLFELLNEFRARHPRIRVKLQTGDPEQAMNRVLSGDAQISIGARPPRLPSGLAFKHVASTPLVFIASSDVPNLHARTWLDRAMILPAAGVERARVDRWFADQGITPNLSAQVAGNEAIVSMVSLGSGIGVVPELVLANSPLADHVSVLPVTPQLEPLDVGLFVQKKRLHDRVVAALWSGQ
ncbi:MAG: HTH-type transcriptional activator IlvY [Gammaproteobacteria bacterium]